MLYTTCWTLQRYSTEIISIVKEPQQNTELIFQIYKVQTLGRRLYQKYYLNKYKTNKSDLFMLHAFMLSY